MVLCTMKNHSPPTLMAAALLGAAVATTMLLTNEPLGLSLTPRMEMDLRKTQVRAPPSQKMTPMHLAAIGCRMSDSDLELRVRTRTRTRTRARAAGAAHEPLLYGDIYHSSCHLMELMSPPLPNRGALAAGMEPSSPHTNVRWTVKEMKHARYANSTLPPCSPPCGIFPSMGAAPSSSAVPHLLSAVPHTYTVALINFNFLQPLTYGLPVCDSLQKTTHWADSLNHAPLL